MAHDCGGHSRAFARSCKELIGTCFDVKRKPLSYGIVPVGLCRLVRILPSALVRIVIKSVNSGFSGLIFDICPVAIVSHLDRARSRAETAQTRISALGIRVGTG